MLRSTLATLIGLLLCTAAFAAPVLKSDVLVSGPIVTVGDMFAQAGDIAAQPLFRAPKPGTSGLVALTDIDAAMGRLGLEDFDRNGIGAVRVSRAAALVDETLLSNLISADLAARGIISPAMSVETFFAKPVAPINAEAIAEPASIVSLRYLPGNGSFTARFALAGMEQPLDVSGTIELMIDAPHVTSTLPAGTLLTADNVELRKVPLKFVESTGVARLVDVIGKALLRQSRDGMMLKPADVTVPLLVGKNDLVTIYFRKGPMTLTVKGQAITGAASGGLVQVLNLMSKRVISAKAIAAGAVEVSADPLALAGL